MLIIEFVGFGGFSDTRPYATIGMFIPIIYLAFMLFAGQISSGLMREKEVPARLTH